MQVQVKIWDRSNPPAFQEIDEIFLHATHDEANRQNIDLQANVKVDVRTQFTHIRMVYLKTDGNAVRVYKGWSPEYWEVNKCWLAWDVDIARLSLMATADTTVTVVLWGDRE